MAGCGPWIPPRQIDLRKHHLTHLLLGTASFGFPGAGHVRRELEGKVLMGFLALSPPSKQRPLFWETPTYTGGNPRLTLLISTVCNWSKNWMVLIFDSDIVVESPFK